MEGRDAQYVPSSHEARMREARIMSASAVMPRGLGDGTGQISDRISEMGSIMQRLEGLEELAAVVRDRVGYVEHRLLSPVLSGPGVAGAGTPLQPEPSNLLAVLNDRVMGATRALESALGSIERLSQELCD